MPTNQMNLLLPPLAALLLLAGSSSAQQYVADIDVPLSQYQALFNQRVAAGYRPIAVTAHDTGTAASAEFQVIWKNDGQTTWIARHELTLAQFQSVASQQLALNHEPLFVASYGTFPNERYATAWGSSSSRNFIVRAGLTSAQYQTEFANAINQGFSPSWIAASGNGADRRYSAFFATGGPTSFIAGHDRSRNNFANLISSNAPNFRLVSATGYGTPGALGFGGILHPAGSTQHESRVSLTLDEMQVALRQFALQGWRPAVIIAFDTNSGRRYTASWEALPGTAVFSAEGPTDASLSSFDTEVENYMRARSISRGALAVMRDGKLVHSRGYTFAAPGTLPTLPRSMFRIASVSKPITAVGIMKLVEQGRLNLSDRILPLLGHPVVFDARWNDITIDHLLTHTAGFDRNLSPDPMFNDVAIASTLGRPLPLSTDDLIHYMSLVRPLDFTPGARYAYSGFGYCLLGRAIESVTGQDYEDWMLDEVLTPLGCGGMRVGHSPLGQQIPNEVNYVDAIGTTNPSVMDPAQPTVPQPYGAFNLHNLRFSGGWVGSAADLARFASQMDRNRPNPVLSQPFVNALWDRPAIWSPTAPAYYGRGWLVRTVNGPSSTNMWHNGSLSGTYSLMVKRHDGLEWAVVFNQRSAGALPPSADIGPALHSAANAVTSWPTTDLADTAANLTTSGEACGSATSTPFIHLGGGTLPRLGETFDLQVDGIPTGSTPILFYAFQNQSWLGQPLPIPLAGAGAPGCSIYLPPVDFFPVPHTNGQISLPVAVDNDPALVGIDVFVQVLVPDPTANSAGVALSNLARIRFGSH